VGLAETSKVGKEFTARFPDGSERFAASFSMDRAKLFFDIARLLEQHVGMPCGISDDCGDDVHIINPEAFIAFFERFWDAGWLGEDGGFLYGWAQYAAGAIENVTLEPRRWIDRNGRVLEVRRYPRPDE
jgi:hypothetical protein